MAFLAILIATVLIVAAIRNTHGNLFGALMTDVPQFAVWGAALFALAVIGFLPGLKTTSRALLWLVFMVIVLTNYRQIIAGFQGIAKGQPAQTMQPPPLDGVSAFLQQFAGGNPQSLDFSSFLGSSGSDIAGSVG